MDSGCDNHMTGNKYFFSSLDSSVTSQIKLGDDYQKKFLCNGVVLLFAKQDENKDIHDVYYVPRKMKIRIFMMLDQETVYNKIHSTEE